VVEYFPTWVEWTVTAGIWAMGLFVLTVLVRVALAIEPGELRSPHLEPAPQVLPKSLRQRRPRRSRTTARKRHAP
jgi:hypothetical protein